MLVSSMYSSHTRLAAHRYYLQQQHPTVTAAWLSSHEPNIASSGGMLTLETPQLLEAPREETATACMWSKGCEACCKGSLMMTCYARYLTMCYLHVQGASHLCECPPTDTLWVERQEAKDGA
ncbi:hypothetical protein HaLaN_12938, partial [Haematococcus lacustris]